MTREMFWGDQPAEAVADVVRKALALAQAKPEPHYLRTAFEYLVRFHERRLVAGEVDDASLARFRADVDGALPPLIGLVRDWAIDVKIDAQDGHEEDHFEACRNRSAMQYLLDDHGAVPDLDTIREDVELLDEELRRMCESYGPISDEHQPRGLPASHWWWACTEVPEAT